MENEKYCFNAGKYRFICSITNKDISELNMTASNLSESSVLPKEILLIQKMLNDYFRGKKVDFDDIKTDIEGTPFQKKVWNITRKIPYGNILSYGEIAHKLGDRKKARAVGSALNKNPVMIIIPCHRVLGKNKDLCGFRGGIKIKKELLEIEKIKII